MQSEPVTFQTGHLSKPGRRCGFTLVEMLVALTIGSLLVVSVVSATRALSRSRESVDRRVERQAAARRAMETVVAALRNVRRDPDPTRREPVLVGQSGAGSQGTDRIDLLVISDRRCRPDGAESDQYEVSFSLARPPGAELPALMCRKDHALDEYPEDGGLVTVVAEGIVGLSFEYLSGERWMNDWSALEPGPPDAVRVTVAAADREPASARAGPDVTVLSTVVAIGVYQPPAEQTEESSSEGRPGGPT